MTAPTRAVLLASGPLSDGLILGDEVECPWHGAPSTIKSGKVTLDPAIDDVARYNVRVTGDDIEIEIEQYS